MQIQRVRILLLALVVAATGCSTQKQRLRYVEGLSPIPDAETVKVSTENQNAVFQQLLIRAQFCADKAGNQKTEGEKPVCTVPDDQSAKWGQFVEAGFGFVDEQCEQYMDSLFWYNRFRNTTAKQLSITGAAAASVMGILNASASAIAVTAAAFGFTSASFDNLTGSLLYELEPSGIKSLVDRSKAAYRSALGARVDIRGNDPARLFSATDTVAKNRPEAMALIQGYLALCLPTYIEAQVNSAVAATDFTKSQQEFSFVPSLTRIDVSFEADAKARALEKELSAVKTELALERVIPASPPPNAIKGAKSELENLISVVTGMAIQEALCVTADAEFGDKTREAIKLHQQALEFIGENVDGILRAGQIIELEQMGSCDASPLGEKNIYERKLFGGSPKEVEDIQAAIDEKLKVIIANPPTGLTVTDADLIKQASGFSGKLDERTRDAIAILQKVPKANGTPVGTIPTDMIEGQVTPPFLDLLL